MKKYIVVILLTFIYISNYSTVASAQTNAELEEELKVLRREFEQMKTIYEQRIKVLEEKVAGTEKPSGTHKAAPVGSYGGLMNPDISVVVDMKGELRDRIAEHSNRDKISVNEAEFAFQSYLYPGIRGDVVAAIELEYDGDDVSSEIDLEEAYLSFLELPLGFQAEVGRRLMPFGKLNPHHAHHRPFADTPLAIQNFLGHHVWFDDGISVSALVPNPWDLYVQQRIGAYNGREIGPVDDHMDWGGHIFLSRTNTNIPMPFDKNLELDTGYSFVAGGEGDHWLHGADATFSYRWPMSYRKFKWQTELLHSVLDNTSQQSVGFYTMGLFTLDKNWEFGGRYDWSQSPTDDRSHDWAISPFITYHLTESFYIRGQYRFRDLNASKSDENAVFLQCVWGFGPHSHRVEE